MLGEGKGLRPWVYYASSKGPFRTLHQWTGPLLIAFFLSLPWLQVGGERLLRIDILGRRLDLLGMTFGATDTRFLLVIVLTAALGLGLLTALAGRLWCGWLCPQTVFLEGLIRPIEAWLEGDRGARMRLDKAPWSLSKALRKGAKWSLFIGIAFLLSMTFVAVFSDPWRLWSAQAGPAAYAFVLGFTFLLAFDLGWFREQFCNYLCPYARIQGVLTDEHSWVIAYDTKRGEPRLRREGTTKPAVLARGGCVDCTRCVTVCPQGIDIREGFQLECIACGHCIDACSEVMGKHGFPSLVTYTTEARQRGEKARTLRVRPMAYVLLITGILGFGLAQFAARGDIEARFSRGRGGEVGYAADGREQNRFQVHLWNHGAEATAFTLHITDWPEAQLVAPAAQLVMDAGAHRSVPVFVLVPAEGDHPALHDFHVEVRAGSHVIERAATFMRPSRQSARTP